MTKYDLFGHRVGEDITVNWYFWPQPGMHSSFCEHRHFNSSTAVLLCVIVMKSLPYVGMEREFFFF